jgi:hypothetical protein
VLSLCRTCETEQHDGQGSKYCQLSCELSHNFVLWGG